MEKQVIDAARKLPDLTLLTSGYLCVYKWFYGFGSSGRETTPQLCHTYFLVCAELLLPLFVLIMIYSVEALKKLA